MNYPRSRHAPFGLLALLFCGGNALAQIRFVESAIQAVPLAAGSGTTLVFQLRNSGIAGATIQLASTGANVAGGYTLASAGDCPLPAPFVAVDMMLAAGELRECRFLLQRGAKSRADTRVVFGLQENGSTVQQKQFRVGDLTRLEWTQQLERPPAVGVPARVLVTVRNIGPTAVESLTYGNCVYLQPQSAVPRVVGGDCTSGGLSACFTGGVDAGFSLTGLAAGASRSCLLEWQPVSLAPVLLALQALRRPSDSGQLENSNPAADEIALQVLQPAIVQQLPTLGWAGWLLLLAGIWAIGRRNLHGVGGA